jgi:hypothetical protein
MPDMLAMTAGQVGHPIAPVILMKTNNRLLHSLLCHGYL